MARPNAPEKIANAVRSIPSRSMPTKKAKAQISIVVILCASTRCVSSRRVARRSSVPQTLLVDQAAVITIRIKLMPTAASQSESRMLPNEKAIESSVSMIDPAAWLVELATSCRSIAASIVLLADGAVMMHPSLQIPVRGQRSDHRDLRARLTGVLPSWLHLPPLPVAMAWYRECPKDRMAGRGFQNRPSCNRCRTDRDCRQSVRWRQDLRP